MKYRGADIRIVNIPKGEIVEKIKKLITSKELEKDKIEVKEKATLIRAINPIDSYWKFWWKGYPQIVEWGVIDLGNGTTRIEIRFGLQRKFRLWYWVIFIGLIILISLFYELLSITNLRESPYYFNAVAIIAIMFLMGFAVFIMRSVAPCYGDFVTLFKIRLKGENDQYFEKKLKSDNLFPDSFQVVIISLIFLSLFTLREVTSNIQNIQFWMLLLLAIFIICSLFLLILLTSDDTGLTERTVFIFIAIRITLPLLFFYNLPNINFLISPEVNSYDHFLDIENSAIVKKQPENQKIDETILSMIICLKIFFYVGLLCICIYNSMTAYKFVLLIRKRIGKYFYSTEMDPAFHNALDFMDSKKKFSFSILFLWMILTAGIYWSIYTAFSVLKFTIFGEGLPLTKAVSENFFKNVAFYFGNLFSNREVIVITKIAIFLYTFPLIWILYKVGKKRLIAYFYQMKEFKGNALMKSDDSIKLFALCKDIAMDIGVYPPDIVVIPSIVPKMSTQYIGFPYFKPYILMTEACLKLKASEIEGLIAHEIFHIKHHSFKWYLLNLLSDFTLFGNGFLAVLTNSYLNELKADDYAVKWLKKNKNPLFDFVNALQIMAVSASIAGKGDIIVGLGIEEEKNDVFYIREPKSILNRIRNNFDIFIETYFGNQIMSYIHPSLEERIARIKVIENSS